MISLILPYWNRQRAADKALALIAKHYPDVEVIVVDDGSQPPFVSPGNVTVVTMPQKKEAKANCTVMNYGVAAASNDFIALSSVEMLHVEPVLHQMREELEKGDSNTYVSAAVWCAFQNKWHSHSSLNKPPLHFMTMLRRNLWDRAGGFDEEYRDGMCFDDNDFVNRLLKVGMHYVYRDDLIVEHPRHGAKAKYTLHQHERNKRIFKSKWG